MILHGECIDHLMTLESDSVDALVTDPPAGISFMGKTWDADKGGRDHWIAWLRRIMQECYQVMKPGAHGVVWALPRTSHWTATALEDAGFEVRDVIMHVFGSGFPKSLDVSKAIDKAAGAEREVVGKKERPGGFDRGVLANTNKGHAHQEDSGAITAPATDDAKRWQGFGTALKPASEHWILIRKPLSEKNVAANVLKHGTGAINIDGCRVGYGDESIDFNRVQDGNIYGANGIYGKAEQKEVTPLYKPGGRFPANLIVSGSARDLLDEQSGVLKSGQLKPGHKRGDGPNVAYGGGGVVTGTYGGDTGGASRFFADCADYPPFFYTAKPSKRERDAGLAGRVTTDGRDKSIDNPYLRGETVRKNHHPTVKPVKLMRYFCRLVCPPGGIVLDPFAGSGTTGVAAILEGFRFIGIEREAEYVEIARARIEHARKGEG